MARYTTGCLTSAGSTTTPIASLYAHASVGATLVEVGVTNTTTTAVALKLVRLTTTGTQGTALTEAPHDPNSAAASCTAFNTHSADPTLGADLGFRASLGASVGSGIIWRTENVRISTGVANGIGILVENGTGQACQVWMTWDE